LSALESFAHAVLPGARRGVAAAALVAFLTSWNEYSLARALLRDTGVYTLTVSLNNSSTYVGGNAWQALVIVTMIPSIIGFVVLRRLVNVGSAGGILLQR
jgi:multiple sugar transport system permease protein